MLDLADGESRIVLINDKCRNTMISCRLIGHSKNYIGVSNAAAGDKYLGAIDDIRAVFLLYSNSLLCCRVSAGIRLGQTKRTGLVTVDQRTQPLLLLLSGAVLENRPSAQRCVRRNNTAGGAAEARCFFDSDRIADGVAAGAAQFLRELNAHQAVLTHLFYGFKRITLFSVDLSSDRLNFVYSELTAHLLNQCLFFCKPKIHTSKPPKKYQFHVKSANAHFADLAFG